MAIAAIWANLLGAVVVYLYLQFLSQGVIVRHGSRAAFVWATVVFVVYLGLAIPVSFWWMRPAVRAGAWLEEGRPPTSEERRVILEVPRRLVTFIGAAWAGAAVIFGAMNAGFGNPGALVAHIVFGVLLGGLVTTVITYLLAERRHRPVMVLALGGEPEAGRGAAIRGRLLLAWVVGSAVPLVAVGVTPLVHSSGGLVSVSLSVATLAAIGLVAGFFITATSATSISEPLASVRRVLTAVRGGNLSSEVEVDDPGEIGLLQADVNRMVSGLRERRRLEDLFGRHVGEEVARQALADGTVLGGQHRRVSVLFVDLVGSTALAASRPPDEVVAMLNRLFGCVVEAVTAEGGWVNKFEGDAALSVFGAPVEQAEHAAAALRAARHLRQLLDTVSAEIPALDAAIAVSTGTAVAGNVGAVDRYEYTVIGDPVNEAARLCELAKGRAERVLASGTAVAEAGDEARHWEPDGEVVLRGRNRPTVLAVPVDELPSATQRPATAGTTDA